MLKHFQLPLPISVSSDWLNHPQHAVLQALKYEAVYPSALSEFLLHRALGSFQMANYFHWCVWVVVYLSLCVSVMFLFRRVFLLSLLFAGPCSRSHHHPLAIQNLFLLSLTVYFIYIPALNIFVSTHPYLYVSLHISVFDVLLLYAIHECRYVTVECDDRAFGIMYKQLHADFTVELQTRHERGGEWAAHFERQEKLVTHLAELVCGVLC
jgi:hypothetical protein